jgi:AcrR family transcriptional regulator
MAESTDRREQLRQERRRQILDAALYVFAEKGFHAANVSDVAARAGVSQGTIYWYFESKDALLHELMDEIFQQMLRPYREVLKRTDLPPLERLAQSFRASVEMVSSDWERFKLLIGLWGQPALLGNDSEAYSWFVQIYQEQVLGPLAAVVEEGMRAGEIEPGDPEVVALALGAMVEGLVFYAVAFPEFTIPLGPMEQVLRQFLRKR